MKIQAAEGYSIVAVSLVIDTNTKGGVLKLNDADFVTVSKDTATAEKTLDAVSTVTLSVSSSTQVRIKSITITYSANK